MTISFDAWKDGNVLPTTHAVLVAKPRPGPKPEPVSARFLRTLVHPERKANLADIRFFANGAKLFVAGYPSGIVQIFDFTTGKELRRIESPPGYRGSRYYALPTPDGLTLYVPMQRRKVVRFEKDGKKQVRIEYNGELLAWDLASGKDLPPIKPSLPGRGVLHGYMSPAGDKWVTAERQSQSPGEELPDETVLWDLKTRTATSLGNGYGGAGFSPDGRRLAVALLSTQTEPSRLIVTDLETRRQLFAATGATKGKHYSSPVFSTDGRTLAVQDSARRINEPETIRLYDVEAGNELAAFDSAGKYPFLVPSFSPDGRRLAATDYNGSLTVWDVAAKKVERTYFMDGMRPGLRVAFSPEGNRLAVVAQPKIDRADLEDDPDPADLPQARVFLFDLLGGGAPEVIICPHGYAGGLAFSPDGKTIAVGGTGVHLFDVSKK